MGTSLRPDETTLVGQWQTTAQGMVADEVSRRIQFLVAGALVKVASSGWETLFRDPSDQRFWELTYPQSELHGGGPPRLSNVTSTYASQKYGAHL